MNHTGLAVVQRGTCRTAVRASHRLLAALLVVPLFGLGAAGCATPRATALVRAETILPLRADTVPVTLLTLGSDTEARVLVDTGAETSVADDLFAVAAELPVKSYFFARRLRGIGWTRRATSYALSERVRLGDDAEARHVALHLVDLRNLPVPGRQGAEMPQVVLGANVLRALVTIFDAGRGELVLVPPGSLSATLARRYPGREFVTMRLDWSAGAPIVRLSGPDGETVPLLLDTGAEMSVIGQEWVDHYGFADDGERLRELVPAEVVEAIGEASPFRRVVGLRLGPRPLAFTAVRTKGGRGILGNDVLRTFPFALDGPRGLLVFPVD